MSRIGRSELEVFPLCLGGNVFGWTADEGQSFEILDQFAAAGGNFIDTADAYSAWLPGHVGGESETIIGRWMASRGTRQRMVIATKVGALESAKGLSAANIRRAAEDSLRRLGVDRIDLYFAHFDDVAVPVEETVRTFDGLVKDGKVRYVAASNFTAPRLSEAVGVSDREGLTRYVALQPHYNLVNRSDYEGPLRDLCLAQGLSCVPYFSLAMGFLTGKYRPGVQVESPRAAGAAKYLDERGLRILDVLDDIAAARATTVAAVSLAWLRVQPTVAAPIASARSAAQLTEILPGATLTLSQEEVSRLEQVSRSSEP
jgi:aryl-alcohol dehydrogenase-like predicted oxidoreductase